LLDSLLQEINIFFVTLLLTVDGRRAWS